MFAHRRCKKSCSFQFCFDFLSLAHSFQVYNEKHSSLTHTRTHKHTQDVDLEISYLFMPNLCYHPSIYPWIYIDLCWFLVFKREKEPCIICHSLPVFLTFFTSSVLFFTRWMLFSVQLFFSLFPPLYSSLVNGCYFMWDVRAGKPIECSVYIKKPLFSWLHKRNQALLVSNCSSVCLSAAAFWFAKWSVGGDQLFFKVSLKKGIRNNQKKKINDQIRLHYKKY